MSAAPSSIKRPITPITDLATGQAILEQLPLAHSITAEQELAHFLESLYEAPPPIDIYLALLEQVRLPLQFVAEDMARRYIGKPLPFEDGEEVVFQRMIEAWRRMARGYSHCAQLDTTEDTPRHAARVALILHRCITYTGIAIIEHHRARRAIPPGLWLDLHGYYDTAEEWRVANVPVADPLDPHERNTDCVSIFVMLLLTDIANPFGLSVREQGVIRRWATNWAPLVSVMPVDKNAPTPEYVIDLIQDTGLYPASFDPSPSPSQRRLDTSKLTETIKEARQQLKDRISPSQIGLGEDCTSSQAQRLLSLTAKPWAQASTPRRFRRYNASGKIQVAAGFDSIHFYISGKEFTQPQRRNFFSQEEAGLVITVPMTTSSSGLSVHNPSELSRFALDTWEMLNQSANGFRVVRSSEGARMEHGQLIALSPASGARFLIGEITWLMQEDKKRLAAGIAVLPGMPQAVAARPVAANGTATDPYSRALILPKVEAINEETSLILPPGWFQKNTLVEVFSERSWHVRLTRVLKRGPDYERIGYEPAK